MIKTITRKQRSAFDYLNWEQAEAKEMGKLLAAGAFGEPVELDQDVRNVTGVALARFFVVDSVRNYDMTKAEHEPRCRGVYGGSHILDGKGQLREPFQKRFLLPASEEEVRIFLGVSQIKGWCTRQVDVNGAYLLAKLPDDCPTFVEMQPSTALCHATLMEQAGNPGVVARFKNLTRPCWPVLCALYGHPLSGYAWNDQLEDLLINKLGYVKSTDVTTSIFIRYSETANHERGTPKSMIIVYVDDGILAGPAHELRIMLSQLKQHVKLKTDSPVERFLGCDITIRPTGHSEDMEIEYNMASYMTHCAAKVREDPNAPKTTRRYVATPALTIESGWSEAPGSLASTCASHVCSFLYGVRWAGPAETYAIGRLGRRLQRWTIEDDRQLLRLTAYVEQSPTTLIARASPRDASNRALQLVVWTDADLAGDGRDRRSIEGMITAIVGDNGTFVPVSWKSHAMPAIAVSTGESEVRALSRGDFPQPVEKQSTE